MQRCSAPKGKGSSCDSSRDHAGNGFPILAQTAGGRRKGVVWDFVKDVEFVIEKAAARRARSAVCADSARNLFNEARTAFRHTTGCKEPRRSRQPSFARTPGGRQSKTSTGDAQHAAKHRREGDLGSDTNCAPGRSHRVPASPTMASAAPY